MSEWLSIWEKEDQKECQKLYASICRIIYFQMVCQKLCQNSLSGWVPLKESNSNSNIFSLPFETHSTSLKNFPSQGLKSAPFGQVVGLDRWLSSFTSRKTIWKTHHQGSNHSNSFKHLQGCLDRSASRVQKGCKDSGTLWATNWHLILQKTRQISTQLI